MLFFFIVLLALTLELLLAERGARAGAAALRRRLQGFVPQGLAPIALSALVVAFAIELAIVASAARSAFGHVPWLMQLPIPITYAEPVDYVPQVYRAGFVVISFLESLLVGVFLLAVSDRPWRRVDTVVSAIAAVVIAALAVTAPAITSGDMYAYVGDALLGPRGAYAPPPTPLSGEYAIIHRLWGLPLLPAAYGPLWIWGNSMLLALATGLYAKLILLRLLNVVALIVTLGALRVLGVAPSIVAATASNPAIAFYYLANGHNDIVPVAVILLAMTFAARWPVSAGIVAGIAASIKLTLVVPAAAVASVIPDFARRWYYVAVMLIAALLLALVFGGRPYLHSLYVVAHTYSGINNTARIWIPHVVVALVALALTALAVISRHTFISGAFGFVSLAQAFFPWYTIWGLPYAARRSGSLAVLLAGFPIAAAVLDGDLRLTALGPLIVFLLLSAISAALIRKFRLRPSSV